MVIRDIDYIMSQESFPELWMFSEWSEKWTSSVNNEYSDDVRKRIIESFNSISQYFGPLKEDSSKHTQNWFLPEQIKNFERFFWI